MDETSFPLQKISVNITWTPAQRTILWFVTGKKDYRNHCKLYINGLDYKDCHFGVNYLVGHPNEASTPAPHDGT